MRVDIRTRPPDTSATRAESPYISDASNKLLEGYMRLCAQSHQTPPSLAAGSKKCLSDRRSMTISSSKFSSTKNPPKEEPQEDHMIQYRMSKASYDAMETLANSLNSASNEDRSIAPVQIVLHRFESPRSSFTNKQPFTDINDSDVSDYGSPSASREHDPTSHMRAPVRQPYDDVGLTLHAPKTHRERETLDSPCAVSPRPESPTVSPVTSPRADTELDCSLWFRNFSKKCAMQQRADKQNSHDMSCHNTPAASPQPEAHEMRVTLPSIPQVSAQNSPRFADSTRSDAECPNTKAILASYGADDTEYTTITPAPDELQQPSLDDSFDTYEHSKRGLLYKELSLDESVNHEPKPKKKFAFVQKMKVTPQHGVYTPKRNPSKMSPSKHRPKKVAVDIPHLIDSASLCVSITSNDSINSLSSFRKVPIDYAEKYTTIKKHHHGQNITAAVPRPPQFAIASTRPPDGVSASPIKSPTPSPRVRIVHSDGSVSYASQNKLANRVRQQRSPQRVINWETSQRMNYRR